MSPIPTGTASLHLASSRPLSGMRTLVCGGASGIGQRIAREFHEHGATVGVLDLHAADSDERVGVTADLRDDDAVRAGVAQLARALGGIDTLVYTAGVRGPGTVASAEDEVWQACFDVNVMGMVRACRAAWTHLAESDNASVIAIASLAGRVGLSERAPYTASKGALIALIRAIAADGVPHAIRANSISPGATDTPWLARVLDASGDPRQARSALESLQLSGRLVRPDEVAATAVYLAGPTAASVTGMDIAIDGGASALRVELHS